MTVPFNAIPLVGDAFSGNESQYQCRMYRSFMAQRLSPDRSLTGYPIIPMAIAWPFSADKLGRSYPAGLVGVYLSYIWNPGATDPTTYNQQNLFPVPSTLPAGYTPRWERDWQKYPNGNAADASRGFCAVPVDSGSLPPKTYPGWLSDAPDGTFGVSGRIRSPLGGVYGYAWTPGEVLGQDCFAAGPENPDDPFSFVSGSFWTQAPTAGFRYFRGVFPKTTVTQYFSLRHNSDGSNTGTGDTELFNCTIPSGVGTYDTGYLGPYQWALGTKKYIYFGYSKTATSGPYANTNAYYIYIGQRVDIPLPFTVTGAGGIIAPGGILTGAVPGF